MADEGWQGRAGGRCRDQDGVVERARQDHAGALGADQGSDRARRDARVRLLRSRAVSAANSDVVRDALGGRTHLPRSATPPRVRDPAAVVGSGDPPNHAAAARSVLAGGAGGGRAGGTDRQARSARGCLVPQAGPDVRRLPRRCQAGAVGRGGGEPDPVAGRLSHLARTPTNRRKSQTPTATSGRADVLRRLTSHKRAKVQLSTGRPGYAPKDLLKLYIYGYLNRVRSSRRLEAEAHRNIEVIWLLRHLQPDFKTIADFCRDNRTAFRPIFRQFVLLCRQLDSCVVDEIHRTGRRQAQRLSAAA